MRIVRDLLGRRGSSSLLMLGATLLCTLTVRGDDDPLRPSGAARLKFLQQILRDMPIESTEQNDTRELKCQLKPILRYNDATREIADSMVFRLGLTGRPIALITGELYRGTGRQYLLNHEFLAIDSPRLKLKRDGFVWTPEKESEVRFQKIENEQKPATNARGRLAQLKQISSRFAASETWQGSRIELRILPTPIDRYVPSPKPNADGALFAFVQGVNPEAVLLLETDGQEWSFGWARMGVAKLDATLDDRPVWEAPLGAPMEGATAGYTSMHRTATIPAALEVDEKLEEEPEEKTKQN